ncbi:hypothetical protein [Pseudonocardia sp.]|uniref:hypothetical protein n=1 Tax=Pseudonocardia sp. TaxID=60912 RepID=UPI00261BD6E0|nr:hypothetical protein [Pseudonocardia sp.]
MIRSLAATGLTAAALAATLLAPTVAHASSSGCTAIGDYRIRGIGPNQLCIAVRGSGLNVESARVDFVAPAGGLNNVVLRITFFDVHNRQVEQHRSRLYSGTRTAEDFTIHPGRDYPTGRVCGSITENGVERPGACVGIHR